MIYSARPKVIFTWNLFCFAMIDYEKLGRTDNFCENNDYYLSDVIVGQPRRSKI